MSKDTIVNVGVQGPPARAHWLWRFATIAVLFGVLMELRAIEQHLSLIATAQAVQAMAAMGGGDELTLADGTISEARKR